MPMRNDDLFLSAARSVLLIIDIQSRLMPAIEGAATVIANAMRLMDAAALLGVPALATEQNPQGLGASVPEVAERNLLVLHKRYFDATREAAFAGLLPADRTDIVVCGCEAHVCVMQTVLGLRAQNRRVFLIRDAVGSRRAENKEAAIARLARAGVEVATTEMVLFEWLETSDHPKFREALALVK
jgi:nicotinamidase-related amidase